MPVCTLFLVGFMGSGKTSVGQELARRLGWDFVDLDACIEAHEQQSISEIFDQKGERAFRISEAALLAELVQSPVKNSVIALGGGTFAQPRNRELLRTWTSVFLETPVDELWRRCEEDATKRPLRRNRQHFYDLYLSRLSSYHEASLIVETSGKAVADICAEIERALGLGPVSGGETPKSSGVPAANQARSS